MRPTSLRCPPPARRPSKTRKLTWRGKPIHITIRYRADHVTACEIFYNGGYRSGSDMEALLSDLCILLSILLQHEPYGDGYGGGTVTGLRSSLSETRHRATGTTEPGSLIGLILSELARPSQWAEEMAAACTGPAPPVPPAHPAERHPHPVEDRP